MSYCSFIGQFYVHLQLNIIKTDSLNIIEAHNISKIMEISQL